MHIVPFETHHQPGVTSMMEDVANEFAEEIYSPGSKTMSEMSLNPGAKYWVALADDKVIGTAGLMILDRETIALKAMFVRKEHRGKDIALRLLETVQEWAFQNGIVHVYLGTMIQFKAACRFYEKHGFTLIEEDMLPPKFPANPVDKVFYHKLRSHSGEDRGLKVVFQ